jgi:archaellum component FlaC
MSTKRSKKGATRTKTEQHECDIKKNLNGDSRRTTMGNASTQLQVRDLEDRLVQLNEETKDFKATVKLFMTDIRDVLHAYDESFTRLEERVKRLEHQVRLVNGRVFNLEEPVLHCKRALLQFNALNEKVSDALGNFSEQLDSYRDLSYDRKEELKQQINELEHQITEVECDVDNRSL